MKSKLKKNRPVRIEDGIKAVGVEKELADLVVEWDAAKCIAMANIYDKLGIQLAELADWLASGGSKVREHGDCFLYQCEPELMKQILRYPPLGLDRLANKLEKQADEIRSLHRFHTMMESPKGCALS